MKRKKSIVYLNRDQLEPHPDNPRKDLGDLTELRESIRANGIMQNLTVIPTDDTLEHFRILIGHRRFAASEGIVSELPCVIVEDLTDREQVGIMLCENLQRNDLTFYEQGKGFQMMLDLGDSIEEITEKTGFSSATVKHRVEIAKLPKTAIEGRPFQLTINDLIALEKIKDVKNREKILNLAFDSKNLANRINQEVREERIQASQKQLTPILKKLSVSKSKEHGIRWSSKWETVMSINLENKIPTLNSIKSKLEGKTGLVWEEGYGTIYICEKAKKTKQNEREKSPEELEREKRDANRKVILEVQDEYSKSVFRFLESMDASDMNRGVDEYVRLAWKAMVKSGSELALWNPVFLDKKDIEAFKKEVLPSKPVLWQMCIFILGDIDVTRIVKYNGEADEDVIQLVGDLNHILHKFGYSIPEEIDKKILDGTSELFVELESEADE